MPSISPPASTNAAADADEDDYMNMTFAKPTQSKFSKPKRETPLERHRRLQREADTKGRTKSKAELAAEEKQRREEALSRSLFEGYGDATGDGGEKVQSKGLKMMQKLGYKVGEGLGKKHDDDGAAAPASVENGQSATTSAPGSIPAPFTARINPIMLEIKEGKGGIGLDAERKRKFREEMEAESKRVKADEGEYRERVVKERTDRRNEGLIHGAQKVAERLEAQKLEGKFEGEGMPTGKEKLKTRKLKEVNVLWRGLVREREEKERERKQRRDMLTSLNRDEDDDDRIAMGDEVEEFDIDEEDEELDDFLALDPAERLRKLVEYLREEHHYCFWCKYEYPDAQLEGCPGLTEDDHD